MRDAHPCQRAGRASYWIAGNSARTARVRNRRKASANALTAPRPGPRKRSGLFLFLKPGLRREVPGLFCFAPRWRKRNTHMSQNHGVPGSNPGWGTRFFAEANVLPPLRQCDRNKRSVLLQLGMWQVQGRAWSTGRARRFRRRGASSRLTWLPIRFRRLTPRTAVFQAANAGSIPAGNTKPGATRVAELDQSFPSSTDRAFALQANDMGLSPIVSTISFSP